MLNSLLLELVMYNNEMESKENLGFTHKNQHKWEGRKEGSEGWDGMMGLGGVRPLPKIELVFISLRIKTAAFLRRQALVLIVAM